MDMLTKMLLLERRRAERKAKDIEHIADSVADPTSDYMYVSFAWLQFVLDHPDMTAEEIASAAADGFDVG